MHSSASPKPFPALSKACRGLLLPGLFACGIAAADDLMPLGDEFGDAATMARWQELGAVEGWIAPSFEAADINTTTPGRFRILPGQNTWFNHLRGLLFFKEITGDFVATMRVRVLSRHNPGDPSEVPNRSFSLTGIFIHAPRITVSAAPTPYRTDAVWPPGDFGSDYVANTENYIFLSYGTAGNPGTRQFEIKATRNSSSRLYYASTGLAQTATEAWLQLVRVGDTVVCLRKHSATGPWLVENRYPNPDHPFPAFGPTLQVGITAYTDWPTAAPFAGNVQSAFHFNYAPPSGTPDLISEVDYFRVERPATGLTEAVLEAMLVSYDPVSNATANPPVELAASPPAAPHLGDHANTPLGTVAFAAAGYQVNEANGQVELTVTRTGASLAEPLSLSYQTSDLTATQGDDYAAASGTLSWNANDGTGKTITVTVVADDALAEGDETFTVTLSNLNGPATFPASAPSAAVTVTLEDHPFDQWRTQQFGGVANANQPTAGYSGDPDSDGLKTLVEFGLRGDPQLPSPEIRPVIGRTPYNRPTAAFTPVDARSIRLEVLTSTDLEQWTAIATRATDPLNPADSPPTAWTLNVTGAELTIDPETAEVTVTAPSADPAEPWFFKLSVGL